MDEDKGRQIHQEEKNTKVRGLLKRNDELDIMLDKEREEKKKLQKKLNDLKKLLQ